MRLFASILNYQRDKGKLYPNCPVFDHLQVCKSKVRRPGPFGCVSVNVCLDRQRRTVSDQKNSHCIHVPCPEQPCSGKFHFTNIPDSRTWTNTTRNGLMAWFISICNKSSILHALSNEGY